MNNKNKKEKLNVQTPHRSSADAGTRGGERGNVVQLQHYLIVFLSRQYVYGLEANVVRWSEVGGCAVGDTSGGRETILFLRSLHFSSSSSSSWICRVMSVMV